MPKINSIRDMRKGGSSISEISRQTGCDPKTIKKYIQMDDFRVPVPVTEKRGSKLDPYKPIIDDWMAQDQREWHKQQHTAKRIHDRLLAEYDWKGSYPLVQRYVKEKKAEMRQGKVYQDLVWDPGSMQVDFGQADFIVAGVKTRMHYLVATLPYSNISFVQVFGGETSECVCQGLKDIFEHLGGVPERIVFDNGTGIGRKNGTESYALTELFERFRAHYDFVPAFCNIQSGHEKGAVENGVGTVRRNLFVPTPEADDIVSYNAGLFATCRQFGDKPHYKKDVNQLELLEEDIQALRPLPLKAFDVFRVELRKADAKGMIQLDGCHTYSSRPETRRQELVVLIGAHTIEIRTHAGELLALHKRVFGKKRTTSLDLGSTLNDLRKKPNAWKHSQVRHSANDILRAWVDQMNSEDRQDFLNVWRHVSDAHGFERSKEVMDWFAQNQKKPSCYDALSVAERMQGFGMMTPPDPGQSLQEYDKAFLRIKTKEAGSDDE